jgi:hypothetical protein
MRFPTAKGAKPIDIMGRFSIGRFHSPGKFFSGLAGFRSAEGPETVDVFLHSTDGKFPSGLSGFRATQGPKLIEAVARWGNRLEAVLLFHMWVGIQVSGTPAKIVGLGPDSNEHSDNS